MSYEWTYKINFAIHFFISSFEINFRVKRLKLNKFQIWWNFNSVCIYGAIEKFFALRKEIWLKWFFKERYIQTWAQMDRYLACVEMFIHRSIYLKSSKWKILSKKHLTSTRWDKVYRREVKGKYTIMYPKRKFKSRYTFYFFLFICCQIKDFRDVGCLSM